MEILKHGEQFFFLQLSKKTPKLRSVLNGIFLHTGATYASVRECQHLFRGPALI